MAQKPSAISEISLLDLVRNKKYKSFAQYIKQIENVNEQAQESIINVLSNILVKKVQKDPGVMFSALMLYKMLMIGAVFDFTMDEQYFPMSIHDEVIKICEYKPQIETFSSRGADYFVDLFKIAKTQQNKEIIERSGNSYVLLALELIQSLASWYPLDFFQSKTKSYFKKKYDELLAKKVTFPKKDQLLIIKKVDEDAFKANYQRFIKRMEEIDESAKKQQTKPEAKPPPSKIQQPKEVIKSQIVKDSKKMAPPLPLPATINNTMNIASSNIDPLQKSLDMLNLQGQVTSSVQVHHKNPIVRPKNDPSMIAIEDILATNNMPESGKPNPTLSNVNKQKAPANIIPKKEESKKQTVQRFESSIRSSDSEPPAGKATKIVKEQPRPAQIKKAPDASGIIPNKVEESKPKASQIKPLPARESIKTPPVIKPTQRQVIRQKQPQPARKQNLKKQQKATDREIITESIVTKVESNKIQKADPKTQENLKQSGQLQNILFSFKQKDTKNERINQKTPIKMAKIEKQSIASLQVSPQQMHQQNQISNRPKGDASQRAEPQQTKRPRTMPKTQKRTTTAINFFNPNAAKNQFQFCNQSPNTSKQFNKTLSYWAMNRAKNQPSKQIDKSLSLNSVLQQMRLDYKTLPFIPKYYQPITTSMHALRQQSLTLFNSGISSNQFYSNHTIECRILKQSHNVFTLIIQNMSNDPLLVEYCEMKTVRFSNRIKILSWANKPDITGYNIPRKGYMDIKFKFEVADLNFKFLAFLLRINERVQSIILPITLLDMCDIFTPINQANLYRYSLKGSIISSQPFALAQRGLPSFLGGFRFASLSNSRNRRDPHQIIGECSLRLQNEDEEDPESSVEIVVRIADWQEKLVEIDVIYATKSQYCENLGKVIMYLLMFLMKNN